MNNGADPLRPPAPPLRSGGVIAAFVVMFAAATIATGLRFYTRVKFLRGLKVEDWVILVAWALSLGVTVGFIRQTTLALGRHIWTLSPEVIRASGMEEWYSFFLYTLSIGFTKIAILLLYRRIFPPGLSRTMNHILLAVVMACNVVAIVLTLVACVPLRASWDERVEGKCLGPVTGPVNSILNVLTDFLIFSLPLPIIVRLRMHWRKKAGLLVVFTLGFLVCLVSVIRVVTISKLDRTDTTYNMAIVAYWGAVEVNLPIICACLTTIRPLLNNLFPGILGPHTLDYNNASQGLAPRAQRQVAVDSGIAEEVECRDDAAPSSSSGMSLVIMSPEVEAYESGLGVEPPPKAYEAHSSSKSDLFFSVHMGRAL